MNNYIKHYGIPRRSGRYPWGSGENPFHHKGTLDNAIKSIFGKNTDILSDPYRPKIPSFKTSCLKGASKLETFLNTHGKKEFEVLTPAGAMRRNMAEEAFTGNPKKESRRYNPEFKSLLRPKKLSRSTPQELIRNRIIVDKTNRHGYSWLTDPYTKARGGFMNVLDQDVDRYLKTHHLSNPSYRLTDRGNDFIYKRRLPKRLR